MCKCHFCTRISVPSPTLTLTDVQFCPVSNRDWECARDRARESRESERGRKWEREREREREKEGRRN
jgi:hypothetical protein